MSSTYVGDDQFGHPQFDTKRSDLGELLYQLKYHGDASALPKLIEVAGLFVRSWNPSVELIVPVPPSRARRVQPVLLLAGGLSENLGIAYDPDCVSKTRDVPELKNVYEYDERLRLLEGAHIVDRMKVQGRRELLLDDLYRSGATMNAITALLYDQGGAANVFALTITRTRSNL